MCRPGIFNDVRLAVPGDVSFFCLDYRGIGRYSIHIHFFPHRSAHNPTTSDFLCLFPRVLITDLSCDTWEEKKNLDWAFYRYGPIRIYGADHRSQSQEAVSADYDTDQTTSRSADTDQEVLMIQAKRLFITSLCFKCCLQQSFVIVNNMIPVWLMS